MTIDEIAKRAKVSRSTVSRVMNNNPSVKEDTRRQVERVIRDMNYVPNAAARSLVNKRASVVGTLIYNITQPYWSAIFAGVEQEMVGNGYGVLLSNYRNVKNDHSYIGNHCQSIRNLILQNVDGLIVALYDDLAAEDIELLQSSGKPFVVVQSNVTDNSFSTVNVDNKSIAHQATEYLIEMGHRNIYHATGRIGSQIASDRLAGYIQAMREHQLPVSDENLVSCGSVFDDGYWCMKRILVKKDLPTAILFQNDLTAYGALLAAREEHVRIPEDISIIGIDHLSAMMDIAAMLPDLTSISLPVIQYGVHAARILMDQIERSTPPQSMILPCKLHKGSTVRRL